MVIPAKHRLLGPDGEPIDTTMLRGEIAAPAHYGPRALNLTTEVSGLTPERLAEIMRAANHGLARPYLTLAMEMEERYLHYAGQLQTRRLAMDSVNIVVKAPAGVDPKAVDAAWSLVDSPVFRDMVQDLTDGVAKGYSVVEPVYEYVDKLLKPVEYHHRDPRYFRYDPVGLKTLHLMDEAGQCGLRVERPYFIRHEPKIRTGLAIRGGLARSAAWAFMMQTFTLQDWSAFCEIYGIPLRVGKYHKSATAEDIKTIMRAVRSIANDAAAVIPKDMDIEFHQLNGTHGEKVFGSLIDYLDRKISMQVIGQTMTAENGSSLGQAKVHNQVRHDIMRADGRQNAATINRDLIEPVIAMNLGPQAVYPRVEFEVAEPDDIRAFAGALGSVVPLGLKIGQSFVRKKLGAPDPIEGEELLVAPAGAKPAPIKDMPSPNATLAVRGGWHPPLCRCESCTSVRLSADSSDPADAFDSLVAEQMSGWEKVVDPLMEQLFAAVSECETLEEALAKLDELRLDTSALTRKLAIATTIARGTGDVSDG